MLYFLLRHQYRWILLLLASYGFYMAWKPEYIFLIIISTVIDYFCGIKMGNLEDVRRRKPYLYLSLLSNLGILFFFKYFNFFNDTTQFLSEGLGFHYPVPVLEIILPMGISFYTFQTMSYSIDVYYGRLKPEKSIGTFALYVSFFPQLVAGPIERASNLLPQFRKKATFDYNRITSGLRLMLWGLFKKVVVADRLAVFVNEVYSHPHDFQGATLVLATFFFAFQIYCDFSGYSDIAIGAARVLGFDLMKNFDTPYFSRSISEFWKRWHISLSTWFKDYLYIPLGGNRVVKWRWYYNLFITFLVSGLWHGANWTFVIWGGLHGFYLVFDIISKPLRNVLTKRLGISNWPSIDKALDQGFTFFLVSFAWVFFRANNINDGFYIITHFFDGKWSELKDIFWLLKNYLLMKNEVSFSNSIWYIFSEGEMEFNLGQFLALFFAVALLLIGDTFINQGAIQQRVKSQPFAIRWGIYYCLILACVLLGVFEQNEFIYFQF
ncbi:MBOAT family protein [Cytophagales bacterium RKSG123]|nr:MBOAT family protein [Xanthovirga aplysinae]